MFYSTNQSYHWKLNQSEVAISGRLANQIVRIQTIRRGVTCNTSASEQYIHFLHFFPHFFYFFRFFSFFIFFFIFFFSFNFFFFFIFFHFFDISLIISDIFFHTTFSTSNSTTICTMVVASTGFSQSLLTH